MYKYTRPSLMFQRFKRIERFKRIFAWIQIEHKDILIHVQIKFSDIWEIFNQWTSCPVFIVICNVNFGLFEMIFEQLNDVKPSIAHCDTYYR